MFNVSTADRDLERWATQTTDNKVQFNWFLTGQIIPQSIFNGIISNFNQDENESLTNNWALGK